MENINLTLFKLVKLLLSVLFCTLTLNASSQWNHYCDFTWPPPPFGSTWFVDAEFNSLDTGVFIYTTYFSPSSGSTGYLMRSSNAGSNWSSTTYWGGPGYSSYGIYKLPQYNTFYAVNMSQLSTTLSVSYDGGNNWQSGGGLGYYFQGFYPCDTSKYYYLYGGPPYYLLKYDHGVKYWQHATFTTMRPSLPFFPDTAVGFLVANSLNSPGYKYNIILKTMDGGSSWNTIFNNSTINIRKTYFIDTIVGFACGDSGLILKTSDGGINWQYLNSGVNVHLNTIFFINNLFGFAAGESGTIIRTIDGGSNWTQDQTGTVGNFRKIYAVNDSIMFAMTGKMYSLNINTGTSLWENVFDKSQSISIYPSPASNQITLDVSFISENSRFEIKVFDKLARLLNHGTNIKNSDQYSLNVTHFNNGIYFLIIRTDNKTYSKSFIIDK